MKTAKNSMHRMQITAEAIAKGFLWNASHNISVGSSCMQSCKFCYLSFCTGHVLTVCLHYLWDGMDPTLSCSPNWPKRMRCIPQGLQRDDPSAFPVMIGILVKCQVERWRELVWWIPAGKWSHCATAWWTLVSPLLNQIPSVVTFWSVSMVEIQHGGMQVALGSTVEPLVYNFKHQKLNPSNCLRTIPGWDRCHVYYFYFKWIDDQFKFGIR